MGLIKRVIDRLRGKALKVVLYGLLTLGGLTLGVNLPEPTKAAIVNGSAIVIEALNAGSAEDTGGE